MTIAIGFVSEAPLERIAEAIGLVNVEADYENEWEWVIGELPSGERIDITRLHKLPPGQTETRVLRVGEPREWTPAMTDLVVERLRAFGIDIQQHT